MTLVERVAEWPKQWLREGRQQGVDQQRALLCRQAAARFDADARLADLLAPNFDSHAGGSPAVSSGTASATT